jgi:hypothetical protein
MVARRGTGETVWYRPGVGATAWAARLAVACAAAGLAAPAPARPPLVGFTVHWDFFASRAEAERLVEFAIDSGAEVVNVVPPPHIWEQPASVKILRKIFDMTAARGVGVVLTRIDGSSLPGPDGERTNWLYTHVLTEPGRLPSGQPTPDFFLATVGKPDYERWLREETAYYAENFSGEPNLLAFSVGLFNEPFVSQRGSLLCFDDGTGSYEIGQYTPYAAKVWHEDLARRFGGDLAAANRRFGTGFRSWKAFPMPRDEADAAFASPVLAYFDFVSAINGWVVARLEECRRLWHARARRDVPFLLQFSGYVPEKFEKGRAAFAALDIFDWMRRADGLGLSAYTNCEYPDWGHASVAAMVAFLRLAPLLGKPVFVLESGSECDGAVLLPQELAFLASVVRPLVPQTVIYEFLKTSYDERFATSAGKLLGPDFRPRAAAVAAVREALHEAREPGVPVPAAYVLDDLEGLPEDAAVLALRGRLAALAVQRSLIFVPEADVSRLPPGAALFVPGVARLAVLRERLLTAKVAVESAEVLLGESTPLPPNGPR